MFGLVTWVKKPTTLENIRLKCSYNTKTYCNIKIMLFNQKKNSKHHGDQNENWHKTDKKKHIVSKIAKWKSIKAWWNFNVKDQPTREKKITKKKHKAIRNQNIKEK
jgi:hypothetical protein